MILTCRAYGRSTCLYFGEVKTCIPCGFRARMISLTAALLPLKPGVSLTDRARPLPHDK
jgi:hypothetical protein